MSVLTDTPVEPLCRYDILDAIFHAAHRYKMATTRDELFVIVGELEDAQVCIAKQWDEMQEKPYAPMDEAATSGL